MQLEREETPNENVILLEPRYPTDERYEDVQITRNKYRIPTDRPTRIYCDGIFDLFHYGHSRLFEQVKNLFPDVQVIVGICNDELTTKFKGSTVMTEQERYEGVRQCRFVDEVIEDAPWILNIEFLREHKIDLVAHDEAPYPHLGMDDLYKFVKERGMFVPTKRARKISTTALITRLIKNYDQFLRRQLRRGIDYKDLNISFMKKEQIKFRDNLISDVNQMKEEIRTMVCYWEDFSKGIVKKFKNRFFRDQMGNRSFLKRVFNMKDEIK